MSSLQERVDHLAVKVTQLDSTVEEGVCLSVCAVSAQQKLLQVKKSKANQSPVFCQGSAPESCDIIAPFPYLPVFSTCFLTI